MALGTGIMHLVVSQAHRHTRYGASRSDMAARTAAGSCYQGGMVTPVGRASVTGGAGAIRGVRCIMVDNALRIGGGVVADSTDATRQRADRRAVDTGPTGVVAIIGIDMTEPTLISMNIDKYIAIDR